MAVSGMEQARFNGMLGSLQLQDPDITQIVVYSKFVVAYLLQQDGANPGWHKANIEGPVYVVRRRTAPRFQLMVKNQLQMNDLLDTLHVDWELDCQKNYVFYKVQDPSKRIRGLWFHDDAEREKIESTLEAVLSEMKVAPQEPHTEPTPAPPVPKPAVSQPEPMPQHAQPMQHAPPVPAVEEKADYARYGQEPPQESVTVSSTALRSTLHALADDDTFLKAVMQKLKGAQAM